MLLTAGFDQNTAASKESIRSLLKMLMETTVLVDPVDLLIFDRSCSFRNQYKLRIQLIELVLKYVFCTIGRTIIQTVVDTVNIREQITHISGDNLHKNSFIECFIYIVGYSSKPGRSMKLLSGLLNAMNVNTVIRLKCGLNERQQVMTCSTSDKLRTFTNAALKCIQDVDTPFSLQSLSRSAINYAISTGTLNNESLGVNNLPVHIKAYVLHQE